MLPRLFVVFQNNWKDPYRKFGGQCQIGVDVNRSRDWLQFSSEETPMPAIFWPVNPFPHKVSENEIMECLCEALGTISILHAYDLVCDTISEPAHQRWMEELHYHHITKKGTPEPVYPEFSSMAAEVWFTRYQALIGEKKRKSAPVP